MAPGILCIDRTEQTVLIDTNIKLTWQPTWVWIELLPLLLRQWRRLIKIATRDELIPQKCSAGVSAYGCGMCEFRRQMVQLNVDDILSQQTIGSNGRETNKDNDYLLAAVATVELKQNDDVDLAPHAIAQFLLLFALYILSFFTDVVCTHTHSSVMLSARLAIQFHSSTDFWPILRSKRSRVVIFLFSFRLTLIQHNRQSPKWHLHWTDRDSLLNFVMLSSCHCMDAGTRRAWKQ